MTNIIFQTFLMMAFTFAIGLAVAYLIRLMVLSTGLVQLQSQYGIFRLAYRYIRFIRVRKKEFKSRLIDVEKTQNIELINHYYSKNKTGEKKQIETENHLVNYFYGKV